MNHLNEFKDIQLDFLKEIGNIGAGHAATALSKLLNKPVDMQVPKVNIVSFNELTNILGGEEVVVVTVFLRIEGDISGNMFFILSEEGAQQLVKSMLGQSEESFNVLELSAIQEVGNILSGSYLSSLADFTKLKVYPSVPNVAIDMAAAILSYGLIEFSKIGDYALLIDTTFLNIDGTEGIKGHFFLLPDPDSFNILFQSLGVPVNE